MLVLKQRRRQQQPLRPEKKIKKLAV